MITLKGGTTDCSQPRLDQQQLAGFVPGHHGTVPSVTFTGNL